MTISEETRPKRDYNRSNMDCPDCGRPMKVYCTQRQGRFIVQYLRCTYYDCEGYTGKRVIDPE